MSKKILLTEDQFNLLNRFIVETKFDKLISNVAKPNDIIRIEFKNSTNNFKVLSNDMGQIKMDNIDKGANVNYRYFLTYTGLEGKSLQLKRVHKIKEKDKLGDVKSWTTINVNDVKNIEVIRNGQVIDKVDPPKDKEQAKVDRSADYKEMVDTALAIIINQLNENKGLKLNMSNGEEVLFCCLSKTNNTYTLELSLDTGIKEIKKWDSFILTINGKSDSEAENEKNSLVDQNSSIIKTKDGGKTFSLLVKVNSGAKSSSIWINGILGVSVTPSCSSKDEHNKDEESSDKENSDTDKSPEELKSDGKKAMDAILNDPILKQAFYKQPSLWNLFKAELQGKSAPGTGILPTLQLVGDYEKKKLTERLGAEFVEGKEVQYRLKDRKVVIDYTNKSGSNTTFVRDKDTSYRVKVGLHELGEDTRLNGYDMDGRLLYQLIVRKKSDIRNVFYCDFIKRDEVGDRNANVEKDVPVTFLVSDKPDYGYKPTFKEEPKK